MQIPIGRFRGQKEVPLGKVERDQKTCVKKEVSEVEIFCRDEFGSIREIVMEIHKREWDIMVESI